MSPATAGKVIEVKAQNGLKKKEVQKLFGQLQEKREQILEKLLAPAGNIGIHADPIDSANGQEQIHFWESRREQRRKELKDVDDTTARIFAGTFGKCFGPDHDLDNDDCNGKISFEKLQKCPTLELCQYCAKERLAREGKGSHKRMAMSGQLAGC